MKIKTSTLPAVTPTRMTFAAIATALALLAAPHFAHAQGVIGGMERGANQGAREGNRAAGRGRDWRRHWGRCRWCSRRR
jgi:hypothetical protein